MSAVGSRLQLRLFLEGVEIPVVAATITSQKNTAAVAAIQIPANDYVLDFRARTLVHLFAYDGFRGAPAEQQVWVGGAGIDTKQKLLRDPAIGGVIPDEDTPAPNPEVQRIDLENDNYKLIFGGEVLGISYQKSPSSRSMTLQCADWSSYWDIGYQYQVSGMSLGGGGIKAAFTGASTTVFSKFLEGSGDIVFNLLNTPPRGHPALKGTLLGGIMHMIEALGGVYFGDSSVRGTNDFFSIAEMRLHLTQMIGANPYSGADEQRLLSANGFGSLFSKTLGGLGQLVTIRQVFLALQRYIFHEIVPITSPRYIPSPANPNSPQKEKVPLALDPSTAPIARSAQSVASRALELKKRVESCTDLVACQAQSSARGGLQKELLGLAQTCTKVQKQVKSTSVRSGLGAGASGLTQVAAAFESATMQFVAILNACILPSAYGYRFPLADSSGAARIQQALDAVGASMRLVLDAKVQCKVKRASSQPDPPPRLLTQLYRPDVWMVAPPRCNVLFPEQYSQFSYGRDFLSEVSRILLRTHSAFFGSDILFDGFYMAPSRILGSKSGKQIGRGRLGKKADVSDAPAWVVKDMMDHELFTGIIPSFERMSDLNLHALRGQSGSIEEGGAKVGFAQLACNHLFFQYRFRSRQLLASGRFNPYVTLGFPMVIIDKYLSDDALQGAYDASTAYKLATSFSAKDLPGTERANIVEVNAAQVNQLTAELAAERANQHYLGTPELISHSITSTTGGNTSFQMGYARTTDERTEFLGDNVVRSEKARRTKDVIVPTVVAALEEPRVGTTGILGGEITKVEKVTDRYQRSLPGKPARGATSQRFGSKTLVPLYIGEYGFSAKKRRGTKVPVGVDLPASSYGPEVVALVGSGGSSVASDVTDPVRFEAFRIYERVGSYATQDVQIPPEKLTYPPWYGKWYRSSEVGALYAYFFGVGSITDPTRVLGAAAPRSNEASDDDEWRTLYLNVKSVVDTALASAMSRDQQPPPGLSSVPELPGGEALGPPGDGTDSNVELGRIEANSPISAAIKEIVRIYSAVRQNYYDTPAFVQNYTWRPIASMVDLFGSADLQIDDVGVVTAGREGFHSRAFGDTDDLRQLATLGANGMPLTILGLKSKRREANDEGQDPDAEIAKRMDTRKEKRLPVLRYLTALAASRGVLLG